MPHIPYRSPDDPELRDLVAQIEARRGGRLSNLDKVLLNSPVFAAAWNAFLRTVRTETIRLFDDLSAGGRSTGCFSVTSSDDIATAVRHFFSAEAAAAEAGSAA